MLPSRSVTATCLLLALTENADSFTAPRPYAMSTLKSVDPTIRPKTELRVIMGGSGDSLTNIYPSILDYQDNLLEEVNARAISLFEQYQDAAGFEEFMNSQDNIGQIASVLASRGDDAHHMIVGGSSTLLSSLPDGVVDNFSNKLMMMEQLPVEGKVLAAATATGATGVSFASSSSPMGDYGMEPSSMYQISDSLPETQSTYDFVDQAYASAMDSSFAFDTSSIDQAVSQLLSDGAVASKAASTAGSGMDSTNKILALMEKTISTFDELAAKSGDSLEDVAKQLSDQLYQSLNSPEKLAQAPKYIAKKGDEVLQTAVDEAERLFEAGTSKIIEKGAETIQTARETPVRTILNNLLHAIEEIMKVIFKTLDGIVQASSGSSLSGHIHHFQSSLAGLVSQTTGKISAAIQEFGHVNVKQLAEFVLKEVIFFVQVLAKIFMALVDAAFKTFTGDTLLGNIHHLQTDVIKAVSATTSQLTAALNDIGQIDMQQALHLVISLVAFIAKLLFSLFSALVIVLSGQGIDAWTLQAALAVKQGFAQFATQASEAAMGVAESSISELGSLFLQLLENLSVLLVEAMQGLLEATGVLFQSTGSLAGAMASDTFQSVSGSASMLTANL